MAARVAARADGALTPNHSPYATISHTLPHDMIDHLRSFAHYQRVSASSLIEFALRKVFKTRDDAQLGITLRRKGAGPRRKAAP